MNCQKLEENLPLLLYGELSAWEQAACDEHLAGCANCRAEIFTETDSGFVTEYRDCNSTSCRQAS